MVNKVYDSGLCCSCGMCSGVCAFDAIHYDMDKYGYLKPIVDKNLCKNCGKCVEYCPGNSFQVQETTNSFSKETSFCCANSNDDKLRYESASGGFTTELLAFLLREKYVDYCVVVPQVKDVNNVEAIITNNIEDVIKGKGSKYCPVKMGDVLKQISKSGKKYAIIGVPCQIQVFKRMLKNKLDNMIFISLFCNHCSSANASLYIAKAVGMEKYDVFEYRGRGWPGSFLIKNGKEAKCYNFRPLYLKSFGKYFYNTRCRICNDPFGKNADFAVADAFVNSKEENGTGKTFVIVYNGKSRKIIKEMNEKKVIESQEYNDVEKVLNAFPSQSSRGKDAVERMKMMKKFSNKVALPQNYEKLPDYNAQQVSFLKSFKFIMKIRIYKYISSHKELWDIVFKLNKHKKDKRNI